MCLQNLSQDLGSDSVWSWLNFRLRKKEVEIGSSSMIWSQGKLLWLLALNHVQELSQTINSSVVKEKKIVYFRQSNSIEMS